MKLLSWESAEEKKHLIQNESKGFNQSNLKYPPLFLMISCLFISCVLVLAGGNFSIFGRVVGLLLLFLVLVYFGRVGHAIYIYSPKKFLLLTGFFSLYVYLTFRNYAPVVYGGQDPGYYQIYADILNRGLGARFDSSTFENFENSGSYSLWSTSNTSSSSEIQFYPLLPSTLSLLIPIVGDNAYPVLASLCNLFVVFIVYDYLLSRNQLGNFYLPLIWLFVPASVWFSRIPASEILSIPLLTIALFLPFILPMKTEFSTWVYFFMSACLLLCRANPVLTITLILGILWGFTLSKPSTQSTLDFVKNFFAIIAGCFTAVYLYTLFQPTFWSILVLELEKPSVVVLGLLILFSGLLVLLKRIKSPLVTFDLKSSHLFNNLARFIPLQFFIFINFYVLVSEPWGVYSPENFGVSSSVYQRFGHTPLAFILVSLGFTLFLFKFRKTSIQIYFFLILTMFLLSVAIRSPGIPYSYYFQRYWWSEICLLIFLILATSSKENELSQKNLKGLVLYRNSLVFVTILCQGLAFNLNSTKFTETGSDSTIELEVLSRYLKAETTQLAFTSEVSPEFTSAIIIPLRYHFGIKISRIDTALSSSSSINGMQIISDTACASKTQLYSAVIPIRRLRGVGDFGFGNWIREERPVYICEKVREIKP